MPCPNKKALKSYLTPEEYRDVTERADQVRLSLSRYVRAACLGHELRSTVDQKAILELVKARGDLARLGGLLKKGLKDSPELKELRPLLESMEKSKAEVVKQFEILVRHLTGKNGTGEA